MPSPKERPQHRQQVGRSERPIRADMAAEQSQWQLDNIHPEHDREGGLGRGQRFGLRQRDREAEGGNQHQKRGRTERVQPRPQNDHTPMKPNITTPTRLGVMRS